MQCFLGSATGRVSLSYGSISGFCWMDGTKATCDGFMMDDVLLFLGFSLAHVIAVCVLVIGWNQG